jgi:hypothetical protein
MKYQVNLVGDAFTHLTNGNKGYSVHGKESQYIEWVQDFASESTFYIDNTIEQGLVDDLSKYKYAWLLESKYITPHIVEDVKNNHTKYTENYDAVFTHNQELLALDEKFMFAPAQGFWIKEPKIYEKNKLVSMISSNKTMCEGHRYRLEWVNKLRDKLDLFGRGFNELEFKEDGLCDYMFSVAIENGSYSTYFTEKILDCFAAGTIPIYHGSPDIGDYFNIDGIIVLTDEFDINTLTEDLYHSKLDAIKDNLERVKEMEVLEDYIHRNYFV